MESFLNLFLLRAFKVKTFLGLISILLSIIIYSGGEIWKNNSFVKNIRKLFTVLCIVRALLMD